MDAVIGVVLISDGFSLTINISIRIVRPIILTMHADVVITGITNFVNIFPA